MYNMFNLAGLNQMDLMAVLTVGFAVQRLFATVPNWKSIPVTTKGWTILGCFGALVGIFLDFVSHTTPGW